MVRMWEDLEMVRQAQVQLVEDLRAKSQPLKHWEDVLEETMAEVRHNLVELHRKELEAVRSAHKEAVRHLQEERDSLKLSLAENEASTRKLPKRMKRCHTPRGKRIRRTGREMLTTGHTPLSRMTT